MEKNFAPGRMVPKASLLPSLELRLLMIFTLALVLRDDVTIGDIGME